MHAFRSALLALLLVSAVAAPAAADGTPPVFANDLFHFEVPRGVFVTTNSLHSPEGPVEIVRLQPSDTLTGQTVGHSFLLVAQFTASDRMDEETALSAVADGAISALARFAATRRTEDTLRIGDLSLEGTRWTVAHEGATATIEAAVHRTDNAILVFYRHTSDADDTLLEAFRDAQSSFRIGPAAPIEQVETDRSRLLGLPPLPPRLRVNDR